ncbi:hypothetical protein I6A60_08810 [Frankia sp. AgB1.9]|uniref:hypothetical protein n=1 Tax=unclassified Frankia TaxID=2632575 RepID=UPI0019332464|nr:MULTISPECIES: hypothetical protein [unclassified Frankia]MBL7487225.1 hypothetical protein [Frankia sp. AgW1.1]MBL7547971.1 hypothetical protein [Frankia sp. AgB1.9]MBL7625036.1 hypothetical protein [Frankia sp. AgB1.8]
MTGGGFAGCVLALVNADVAERFTDTVIRAYHTTTGTDAAVHLSRPVAGTSLRTIPVSPLR